VKYNIKNYTNNMGVFNKKTGVLIISLILLLIFTFSTNAEILCDDENTRQVTCSQINSEGACWGKHDLYEPCYWDSDLEDCRVGYGSFNYLCGYKCSGACYFTDDPEASCPFVDECGTSSPNGYDYTGWNHRKQLSTWSGSCDWDKDDDFLIQDQCRWEYPGGGSLTDDNDKWVYIDQSCEYTDSECYDCNSAGGECDSILDCDWGEVCGDEDDCDCELVSAPVCTDSDSDGYDDCSPGDSGDDGKTLDCDDSDAEMSPGKTFEYDNTQKDFHACYDEKDNDCDGSEDFLDSDCALTFTFQDSINIIRKNSNNIVVYKKEHPIQVYYGIDPLLYSEKKIQEYVNNDFYMDSPTGYDRVTEYDELFAQTDVKIGYAKETPLVADDVSLNVVGLSGATCIDDENDITLKHCQWENTNGANNKRGQTITGITFTVEDSDQYYEAAISTKSNDVNVAQYILNFMPKKNNINIKVATNQMEKFKDILLGNNYNGLYDFHGDEDSTNTRIVYFTKNNPTKIKGSKAKGDKIFWVENQPDISVKYPIKQVTKKGICKNGPERININMDFVLPYYSNDLYNIIISKDYLASLNLNQYDNTDVVQPMTTYTDLVNNIINIEKQADDANKYKSLLPLTMNSHFLYYSRVNTHSGWGNIRSADRKFTGGTDEPNFPLYYWTGDELDKLFFVK